MKLFKHLLLIQTVLCLLGSGNMQLSAQGNLSMMQEYKKLLLANKISSESYMVLLLTATNMAAAEKIGLLKTNESTTNKTDLVQFTIALNRLVNQKQSSTKELTQSLEVVINGLGVDVKDKESLNQEINTYSGQINSHDTTIDIYDLSEMITLFAISGNGAKVGNSSALANGVLSNTGLSQEELLLLEAGSGLLSMINDDINTQRKLKEINDTKESFFNTHSPKINDFPMARNRDIYPDIIIDSSNWINYVSDFNFYRKDWVYLSNKRKFRNYKTIKKDNELIIDWTTIKILGKEEPTPMNVKIDTGEWRDLFTKDVKFDFSKDFVLTLKTSSPHWSDAHILIEIGGTYLFNFVPMYAGKNSGVSAYNSYRYDPATNNLTMGRMTTMIEQKFATNKTNIRELVITKRGNTLLCYWECKECKQNENVPMEINVDKLYHNERIRMWISGSSISKGEQIKINSISLKYL